MRVAMLAPPWIPVPAPRYGGVEEVVRLLCDALVDRGHRVTLFAAPDSSSSAEVRPVLDEPHPDEMERSLWEVDHVARAFDAVEAASHAGDAFDVVHDHTPFAALAGAHRLGVPLVHTMHGPFEDGTTGFYAAHGQKARLVAISERQRASAPPSLHEGIDVVHNPIAVDEWPFEDAPSDFLLWIGRMAELKGPHRAIRAARAAGLPLVLAGPVQPGQEEFFAREVEPHIDGGAVRYVGEVGGDRKKALYAKARALLMPIRWAEPFGLVMVEAMACGTPVVAFPEGAATEVVLDGRNGFLVRDEHAMAQAIGRLGEIDREQCRAATAERFDVSTVVARYEDVYGRVAACRRRNGNGGARRPPTEPIPAAHTATARPGVLRLDETSDLWWKNAVVYCVDVKTFLDFDGDGCGDLQGLIHRIDYLAGMGVTCLWLMPFHPTPGHDDGYDITDFYDVDPRLGSLGDFTQLVRMARDRGMRVIVDLVAGHTSDQHPWFQAARADRDSPFRSWYVWRDAPPVEPTEVVFPGREDSAWTYDEEAGQYYLHHFLRSQPDLDLTNPAVRDEMVKVMGFWLALGVSGFRVDAVPFLIDERASAHELLRAMRAFMTRRFGEGILLGEVNLPPDEQREFFGPHGEELNLQFNFGLNQAMYLAFARQDAGPLERVLEDLRDIPQDAAWANFVRNHDELTLDKLPERARTEVFAAFGGDPRVQAYGRGLRRRLPPMVDGDPRRIRLAYSLMFSLPGTPVLLYGEEIGMGDNLELPGRLAVRAPMQWSAEAGAGFTPPAAEPLIRPVTSAGDFGPSAVNVADQRRDPGSLLNWIERLIRRRRECPEIGWGTYRHLPTTRGVFAHRCDWRDATVVAVHNLTDTPREVTLRLEDLRDGELLDLLSDNEPAAAHRGEIELTLAPYDFRWLRARRRGQRMLP